jgi:hypothetical protein
LALIAFSLGTRTGAVLVFSPCAVEVGAEVDEKLELEEPAGGIEPLQWAHNLLREKHPQLNIITT